MILQYLPCCDDFERLWWVDLLLRFITTLPVSSISRHELRSPTINIYLTDVCPYDVIELMDLPPDFATRNARYATRVLVRHC
jgi:hypothetical protein